MLLKSRSHLADAECEHSCSLNTNILSNVTFYFCNLLELFVVTYSRNLIHMRGVQCLQKIKRSCTRLSNNSSCLVGRMWETLAKSKASNYKLFFSLERADLFSRIVGGKGIQEIFRNWPNQKQSWEVRGSILFFLRVLLQLLRYLSACLPSVCLSGFSSPFSCRKKWWLGTSLLFSAGSFLQRVDGARATSVAGQGGHR